MTEVNLSIFNDRGNIALVKLCPTEKRQLIYQIKYKTLTGLTII
jgi:hypothetical protein